MLIDSHTHLDLPQFDSGRNDVIRRARDAGLEMILTIAMASPDKTSIARTLELVEKYDFLYAGIAIHPHDARAANRAYWTTSPVTRQRIFAALLE